MKFKSNLIYIVTILILIFLLIFGYLLNKKNSISKKNEISNITQQLKIRNKQISKIQKNLIRNGNNLNNFINKKEIHFTQILKNKNISKFENYKISKYQTNDILFNANIKAVGSAFIDFFNNDKELILATYDGIFAFAYIKNLTKFYKIDSNISKLIKFDEFYLHDHYGIKDVLVDKKDFYISFIGKKQKDCYDLKIFSAKLNYDFLNFKLFYETINCVNKNNKHEYYAHQGAGGRMIKIDDAILFSTGDFRNRPLAQKLENQYGKILKIDIDTKIGEIVSYGHRNPQGLHYSKKYDFIISTEHGPKGGDEININHKPFLKIKNFGWPISSYGEHYYKNYSKKKLKEAPLNKSHKKFGFVEPLKYFVPSIGISEIISLSEDDDKFLVGAMGNEIIEQDLGLHYIELNDKKDKIKEHKYFPLNERVRDMVISKNKNKIILFLETTSSLAVIRKTTN